MLDYVSPALKSILKSVMHMSIKVARHMSTIWKITVLIMKLSTN